MRRAVPSPSDGAGRQVEEHPPRVASSQRTKPGQTVRRPFLLRFEDRKGGHAAKRHRERTCTTPVHWHALNPKTPVADASLRPPL